MDDRTRVLFLCTGNSCRSQMAEGWVRHLLDHRMEAHSAGVDPGQLDPRAVTVMAEVGVDISDHRSKSVTELLEVPFNLVITVCDHARETCPVFPGRTRVVHQGFEDPPRLAREAATEEEALDLYRRIRDEIRTFVEQLPEQLTDGLHAD
jgi:arsenate reductase